MQFDVGNIPTRSANSMCVSILFSEPCAIREMLHETAVILPP